MKVSFEVSHNLRILGLSPGATVSEVRSAFRRLARTCHPDVAGRQSARRFERIAGAYTFLKNLPQDELSPFEMPKAADAAESAPDTPKTTLWRWKPKWKPDWKWSWHWRWENPLSWRQKMRESLETERERRKHAAEEAGKKLRQARSERADAILARAEQSLESLLRRLEREARNDDRHNLELRLRSDVAQVRHLALARLGPAINRSEVLDAVLDLLRKWDIDEKTARLVTALSFSPENRKKLAEPLACRAACMPDFLLASLLNLYETQKTDRALLERYLQNAAPGGAGFLLRRWPKGPFILSVPLLQNLLSLEDESVLLPLLSTMKQRSFLCPAWSLERLEALAALHPSVAVRVWAKALLPKGRK
jgi:hypothetical protein